MKHRDGTCVARYRAGACLAMLLLVVPVTLAADLVVVERLLDWGSRPAGERRIDTIVLHTSYDALGAEPYDLEGILREYKQYDVAAHYLIDRAGTVHRLVRDQDVAWHAGRGRMPDGRTEINTFSIGIELMNTTTDRCTDAQYVSLRRLIAELKARHGIKHVVGHAQIAPGRKTDPWNFEWERLADLDASGAASPVPLTEGVTAAADGLPIHYVSAGRGEPALVFIHGWSCDGAYWRAQLDHFAPAHRVVALDLAGHGDSGVADPTTGTARTDWSILNYAADVRAVVEQLDLNRVVLVGHSMGGAVAVAAANLLPERVVLVVGIDTLHDVDRVLTPAMVQPFLDGMKADFPGFVDGFVRNMFPASADSALVARVAADMASAPPDVAIPSFAGLFAYDLKAGFAACRPPIRCLNSDGHPTNDVGNRKYARDFDAIVMPAVGHFPQLERPMEFNRLLAELIASSLPHQ